MIEELRIRGIGVFEEASLPLHPGLTALTGETGAGKTMILTGLGLVTGEKADSSLVRHGAPRAEADAVLADVTHGLERWVENTGATLDDGALTLSRVVPSEGRARAFLGGRSVPASILAELAAEYVTVHGQSDQQRLRSPAAQRAALDEAGAHGELLSEYRAAYARLRELEARRDEWASTSTERLRERTSLSEAVREIDELAPVDGEDRELRALTERLTNADELRAAIEDSHAALGGTDLDDGVLGHLALIEQGLAHAGRHDEVLIQWSARIADASTELSQILGELAAYRQGIDVDPAELDRIHERRSALASLMRRWGPELEDVLRWGEQARTRLAEIDAEPTSRDELDAAVEAAHAQAEIHADRLHAKRTITAKRISAVVNRELHGLAMRDARFAIDVTAAELTPSGRDEVTFTLGAHADAQQRPVAQAASGGELSRIMLALELALASGGGHTFVFDEVDAGIGGATATQVARRLAELAAHHQVIVVTHLPQVAAAADRQIAVVKATPGTPAMATVLNEEERIDEIARMLSGDASPTARRHAAELIERSRVAR